jgi:drug/metabolite transporter (DMT)-like permease
MIEYLDHWLEVSGNFNLFVGVVAAVALLSAAAYTYFFTKIGKTDEYGLKIRLSVTNWMFSTLMGMLVLFVLLVPQHTEHFRQLLLLCFSVTAMVGAVSAVYFYVRDF